MKRGIGVRGWTLGVAAFALSLAGAVVPSQAEYPEKPVTVIIPFSAGGSHDVNARVFTSVIPEFLVWEERTVFGRSVGCLGAA